MKSALRPLVLALLALPLALSPRPASATTYRMMSDPALVDQAVAVVEAKVVGAEPAPLFDGPPATDYLVEISRVVKGDMPGSTVVVRVPGGVNPVGLGLKIWGAPRFTEGEEAMLFLRPAQDGTYRILHLMLGAFHKRSFGGRTVAIRDLTEAHEMGRGRAQGDTLRDFERFSDWVYDRARGTAGEDGYVLDRAPSKQLGSLSDSFSLLTPGDGIPIRWFRFDGGQPVNWKVNSAGQSGLGLDATVNAFRVAIEAWDSDPGSNVNYAYSGTTEAAGGLAHSDNVSTILFDDPFRDDPAEAVEGTFDCSEGGVIAIGGPWYFSSTRTYRGKRYHEAVEGDIVTNDGTECLFSGDLKVAQEVFAHEVGHTLGLGHSKEVDALMFARAHDDGRGSRLTEDDRQGIRALYGTGAGPGSPSNLAAPARLAGRATSSTEVTLTWRDKAVGEEGYVIEAKRKGTRRFVELLTVPANSTSALVEDLLPATTYSFRVRAVGAVGFSPYSRLVTVTTAP